MNTPRGVWLDDLTWQEAMARFDGNAVVVLPVASGTFATAPHLPLKTGSTIARALGQRIVDRLAVVMAPVIDAESFLTLQTLRQILSEHLDRFRSLGVRRLAILDARSSDATTLDAAADVLLLRVCNRPDVDDCVTSCMLALDPRSVRMSLLPTGSLAQAFAGERAMAAQVDAAADALVARWIDLV